MKTKCNNSNQEQQQKHDYSRTKKKRAKIKSQVHLICENGNRCLEFNENFKWNALAWAFLPTPAVSNLCPGAHSELVPRFFGPCAICVLG